MIKSGELSALARTCKLQNDFVKTRLPISKGLLRMIVDKIKVRLGASQPYLSKLYTAIIMLGFYGMMRIGELTTGDHPVKAEDVHIG